ncbi:MAG: peptide chain release factor N(5)-glutamine methyltransferase [Chloroflexi bacterium]|nr:peptide chain release factor N(5)-glutamine methyltransferase [Chloroflexota bacterium]
MNYPCAKNQTALPVSVKKKTDPISIRQWLEAARQRLNGRQDEPALSARLLAARHIKKDRAWIIAHDNDPLPAELITALEADLDRLIQGVPLPYVLGAWEFYGLSFQVNESVLIPRPETELLVETALNWINQHPGPLRAADVGTGSGCIAAALAHHSPLMHITAVDISRPALRVARQNFLQLNLAGQVSTLQSDLLSSLSGPLDLICANLPYIPSAKLPHLDVTAHEPSLALDGGPDGLVLVQELLLQARTRMANCFLILLEVEADHGQAAPELARQIFPQANITLLRDLAGLPRLVSIGFE